MPDVLEGQGMPPVPDIESPQEAPAEAAADGSSSTDEHSASSLEGTSASPVLQPTANSSENSPSPATENTAATEIREVTRERQKEEIALVAASLMNRKWREIQTRLNADQELSTNEQALQSQKGTKAYLQGTLADAPPSLSFMKGNPVFIMHQGRQVQIVAVSRDEDGKLHTQYQYKDAQHGQIVQVTASDITPDKILAANAESLKPELTGLFSGDEQNVVALDLDLKAKGDAALQEKDPSQINATIEAAARSAGGITPDRVEAILHASNASPDVTQRVREAMQGKNILDRNSIAAVFVSSGLSEANVTKLKSQQQETLKRAKLRFANNPQDTAAAQEIAEAEAMIVQLDSITNGTEIERYFQLFTEGGINVKQAQEIWDGISSGDFDKMLTAIRPDLTENPNDSDEEKKRKASERARITALKDIGLGAGFLLILAVAGVTSLTSKMVK